MGAAGRLRAPRASSAGTRIAERHASDLSRRTASRRLEASCQAVSELSRSCPSFGTATHILDYVTWTVEPHRALGHPRAERRGQDDAAADRAATIHPVPGKATLLGETLGTVDMFELRPRIGFASTALGRRIPAQRDGAGCRDDRRLLGDRPLERAVRGHRPSAAPTACCEEWKLDHLAERLFGTLSDGEQKRVQIARAVMTDPEMLLLDEPAASLDLGSREELLQLLGGYAAVDRLARDGHGHPPRRGDPARLHARPAAGRTARSRPPARSPRSSRPNGSARPSALDSSCSTSENGRYAARARCAERARSRCDKLRFVGRRQVTDRLDPRPFGPPDFPPHRHPPRIHS